jgi:hypothetical protein
MFGGCFKCPGHNELTADGYDGGRMRGRESQTQFSLRVPENFRAALPFCDELALAIRARRDCRSWSGPNWQYHVTLNCFDGSAHMFLSFL